MSFSRIVKKYFKKGLLFALISADRHYGVVKKIIFIIIALSVLIPASIYGKNKFVEYVKETVVVSEAEIIRKVSLHTETPKEEPFSIVRVQDAETLRKQQDFYKNIKEGDYILMFPSKVIIYDLREDKIIDEKSIK